MFRFLYSTFFTLCLLLVSNYARSHRPKRGKKVGHSQGIEYVGTATLDPSWPEAQEHSIETKFTSGYVVDDEEENIEEDVGDEMDDVYDRMESRVPIFAVISIIIGYICLGAMMFKSFRRLDNDGISLFLLCDIGKQLDSVIMLSL